MSDNVRDLRECSRAELTDQEISSRLHILWDRYKELGEERDEVYDMILGLRLEQNRRKDLTSN